jgi:hypothetical protein
MRASSMPKLSWMTLARGARQLVVQDALLWMTRENYNRSPTQINNASIIDLRLTILVKSSSFDHACIGQE